MTEKQRAQLKLRRELGLLEEKLGEVRKLLSEVAAETEGSAPRRSARVLSRAPEIAHRLAVLGGQHQRVAAPAELLEDRE